MSGEGFGNLTGMRAVVTGASSGIGRSIAHALATGGADVVVHCRRSIEDGNAVVRALRDSGARADLCVADVADDSAHEDFVERAWQMFGGVDVWVNNAGADVLTGADKKLGYAEKLARLIATDVLGTMLLSRLVGRRMVEEGRGVILNIGWDQSDRGMEGDSGELFAASKNAIMGFTRSLALTLAPTVRVNCIAPGWIRTAWGESASDVWHERVLAETPLRRWGMPEDVAAVARFLASPDAAYITGQVINVNGGAVR